MDSMYREFLYFKNPKEVTKFPDFTYGWLGTFEINPNTKKIVLLPNDADNKEKDEYRTQFFMNLSRDLANRMLECVTFKRFLLDDYA